MKQTLFMLVLALIGINANAKQSLSSSFEAPIVKVTNPIQMVDPISNLLLQGDLNKDNPLEQKKCLGCWFMQPQEEYTVTIVACGHHVTVTMPGGSTVGMGLVNYAAWVADLCSE